ncbi:xanthine dehydrogenase family protein molybdopterin-binding subunit [Caldovatus aquaticus]|uniref:Xanthine dehydrogenase family protein molybdopterin-binding subunit n=1 Tax=Caldovatus aquaticus TaxID=2865671 RepID=A0ABS7EZG6_9PROT|nr:xanthine dehydrogenase family protein molybdopterin-binding subunit [Caldovatus aquaticus]MBW8267966.1 xanthine dehydrogenase family protein molybdopterin-binding subunit [Caldovatus aquaticus]
MTVPFAGRREDQRLLTGTGRFTADWTLPGQLHAAFLRSEHAHAEILGLDASAALAAPGVVAVLTGADTLAAGFHRTQALLPYTGRGGEALKAPPRPALAAGRVRYVGEPVALVVAETAAQARDAAERIAVDYRPLPAAATPEAALAPGAPQIHAEVPGNLCFDYEYGDAAAADAAFARAAHVVRLELESARVVGNPMEPKAALAAWDGETLDLWTGTQGMVALRDSLASLTGLPPERIRVRAQDVGGGFGIRGPAYPEHAALALAAKRLGRPVKWVASRSETFLSDYHGRALRMTAELALDAEGRFLAIRHAWLCDQGAYPVATGPLINTLNPAMMCTGCYRIPVVYGRHRLAVTNTVPVTAYRGAGRPDMAYVIERLVDEAARQTGRDRLALRRLNLIPRDAFPYRVPSGAAEYDSGDYAALLDAAAEAADWAGFEARRAEAAARGRLRGIGCALFVEPSGGVVPRDEIALAFTPEGGIVIHSVIGPSGQGHETVMPEIVARALGVPPESVTLRTGDPEGPPLFGGGAFASRSMLSHGAAGLVAAREAVRKGRALAAEALETAEADIEFAAGEYRIAGTDRRIGLLELARRHAGPGPNPLDTTAALPATRAFPSGAHVAEVEVDPDTGEVALLRYVAVDDCGVVLNPTLLAGQILGGMVQGLGQAFGELCAYDPESGQLLTGSFLDYAMPRADLLREVVLRERCVPSPNNPLGVKGAGEAGTTGALPAAMNAVLDALRPAGVRHLDMPASPARVWAALRERVADGRERPGA